MQYTPNYNLITVEGTDVVNPLVQMNPNFTDIDAAMFANKQSSIGSASEIVSGTVHAITRANPDSNYFRFTATGNWTLGDSMSVDGVTVSVYLTDGTIPGTGAYVINSEVFGILAGSRVTLYLASAPVTSLNANQITFDPTGTNLNPNDTDVDKAIKDLDSIANRGYVSVISNGIQTYGDILQALYALIDGSKISPNSVLQTSNVYYQMYSATPTDYRFSQASISSNVLRIAIIAINSNGGFVRKDEGSAAVDLTNSVPSAGIEFKVYY